MRRFSISRQTWLYEQINCARKTEPKAGKGDFVRNRKIFPIVNHIGNNVPLLVT